MAKKGELKMHRFLVTYQDSCDPDNRHTQVMRGKDEEWIYLKFMDSSAPEDGWEYVSAKRLPDID
jgi:hypothetical protein